MNKFIVIILGVLVFGASHAKPGFTPIDPNYVPDWKKITDNTQRTVYLNRDVRTLYLPGKDLTERLMSGKKAMWAKVIYKPGHYIKKKNKKVAKTMLRLVFNCEALTWGYTSFYTYDENDEELEREITPLKNVEFIDVLPDSAVDTWKNYACEEKKKKAK